jgi:predicted ATPase
MIERIYVDNFRTLVNCEIKLGAVSLLLGPNGSGKSAVFDAVDAMKRFVSGTATVQRLFPAADITRWQNLDEQAFEMDLRGDKGVFRYTLKVRHSADRRQSEVASEQLTLDDRPLFRSDDVVMQFLIGKDEASEPMPVVLSRTGLSLVSGVNESTKLIMEFKERLDRVYLLRPCPPVMGTDSKEEEGELDRMGSNFASWYRFVVRQDIFRQLDLLKELRQVIDGFDSIRLEGPADSTATLRVLIRPAEGSDPIPYKFGELSDGQRQLIVLYALLYALSDKKRVLFLDEPDNYLAVSEVEPWLTALMDAPGRTISQAVVISHHPEVIDHLAPEKGIWLTRESAGPTRVEYGKAKDTAPLKPSEVEARGW